ncbi:MAG: hypothetical protein IKZ58_00685 [Selenomonadaceae bacterium]|nr:hypothetical protein [Selenomonadaceae bacterium]
MDEKTWQKRIERRRRRLRQERIALLVVVVTLVSGVIWYVTSYKKTPNYAMTEAMISLHSDDKTNFKKHVDFDSVALKGYDDLTVDLFKYDTQLSEHERSLFENFYVLIRTPMCQGAVKVINIWLDTGQWTLPEEMLKGRQLGIDYDLLLERSLIRHTSIVEVEKVENLGDKATADVKIVEDYTQTPFTLKVTLENFGGGINIGGTSFELFGNKIEIPGISFKLGENEWKVVRVENYREYLDVVSPALKQELSDYIDATNEIVERYNNIFKEQQATFVSMQKTSDGIISEEQRNQIADYINQTIIPTLSQRQDDLNEIPVSKGAQYLANLRKESTAVTIQAWQFYASGLIDDDSAEFDTAESLHKQELALDQRIEELIYNSAIAKERPTLP